MEACSLLVNLRKGMQRSSEQPLVGEERYVTILITAAKETRWLSFQAEKCSPSERCIHLVFPILPLDQSKELHSH